MNVVKEETYGLDIGFEDSKIISSEGKKLKFKSLIKPGKKILKEYQSNTFEVTTGGVTFLVGEGDYNLDFDEYISGGKMELLTLSAIAAMEKDTACTNICANVVVGLPILKYRTEGAKEKLAKAVKKISTREITINDKQLTITINRVFVFMQGAGAIMLNKGLSNKHVILIDIGGWTIDIAQFAPGIELVEASSLLKFGVRRLYNTIADKLNNVTSENYTSVDVESLLKRFKANEELPHALKNIFEQITKSSIKEYLTTVLNEISSRYKLTLCEIVLLGGGGALLFDCIQKFKGFEDSILMEESDFANAKAYVEIGKKTFQ